MTEFPFPLLSTELALEILRLATTPDFSIDFTQGVNPYALALKFCRVSSSFRRAVMPHLLHTVLLTEDRHIHAFIRAILMQRNPSRLAIDYSRHVKRMWCGKSCPPLVDEPRDSPFWLDYGALWEVMRSVESLAVNFSSLHLLYEGLATERFDAMEVDGEKEKAVSEWKCRNLTCVGPMWRWKPLSSTMEGSIFLSQIKELVMWTSSIPSANAANPFHSRDIPWLMMKSLTDIGFVVPASERTLPNKMVVFQIPKIEETPSITPLLPVYSPLAPYEPIIDAKEDPRRSVRTLDVKVRGDSGDVDWERAWAQRENVIRVCNHVSY